MLRAYELGIVVFFSAIIAVVVWILLRPDKVTKAAEDPPGDITPPDTDKNATQQPEENSWASENAVLIGGSVFVVLFLLGVILVVYAKRDSRTP
jgi:hypothetical protein